MKYLNEILENIKLHKKLLNYENRINIRKIRKNKKNNIRS